MNLGVERHILSLIMPVIVSILRSVNVGGHNKIKMDALRELCEALELREVQTFIQSGNVVFKTRERNLDKLAKRIEDAIEKGFGFRPAVILRTPDELRDVLARNPFAKRRDLDPAKLAITFLAADPGPEACARVLAIPTAPEELHIDGRHLYTYYPNGMGRPKLNWAAVERALKTPGTARNLNSVIKLLEMAEKLEASK